MKKKKTTIPSIIKWVIALILVVMQVYPFFYVFTSSFKSLDDFRKLPAYALPSKWVLTNFINVFTKSHMLTYFKNSIIVLIGVLIPLLLFALMAGFALSKIKFKGRKFVLNYFLLGLMLPMQVALIPLFTIFNKMGLINTYLGMMIVFFVSAMNIFQFRQSFKTFATTLKEAAHIDGCSNFTFFLRILLPTNISTVLTVFITAFIGTWNSYLWPLLVTNKTEMRTVQVGITMLNFSEGTVYGPIMAASIMVLLPSLILFLTFQKRIVSGMMAGGVKG